MAPNEVMRGEPSDSGIRPSAESFNETSPDCRIVYYDGTICIENVENILQNKTRKEVCGVGLWRVQTDRWLGARRV